MRFASAMIAALVMLYVTFGIMELLGMSVADMQQFIESIKPF